MPTLAELRELRLLPNPTPEAIEEALETVRLYETGYLGDEEAAAQIAQELRRLRRGGRM